MMGHMVLKLDDKASTYGSQSGTGTGLGVVHMSLCEVSQVRHSISSAWSRQGRSPGSRGLVSTYSPPDQGIYISKERDYRIYGESAPQRVHLRMAEVVIQFRRRGGYLARAGMVGSRLLPLWSHSVGVSQRRLSLSRKPTRCLTGCVSLSRSSFHCHRHSLEREGT